MDSISRKEKERLVREQSIIEAAEKVFYTSGYVNASMDEIAKEAQFSRKTVYQYFDDKEDLLFTLIIKGFQKLLSHLQNSIRSGDNGFEKIKHFGSGYYEFYKEYPETLYVMNYIGYIKPNEKNINKYQEFNRTSEQLTLEIIRVIDEGKEDGSIRTDLDTIKLTHSIQFMTTGFFHMFSISGNTFTNHFSLNQDDFINFSLDLLSGSLKAKNMI